MSPGVTLMCGRRNCAQGPWVPLKDAEDKGFHGPGSVDTTWMFLMRYGYFVHLGFLLPI